MAADEVQLVRKSNTSHPSVGRARDIHNHHEYASWRPAFLQPSWHKPCFDRRDRVAGCRVLFDVHRPIHVVVPHGRLVVAVHHVQLDVHVRVQRRVAAVRGAHADSEFFPLKIIRLNIAFMIPISKSPQFLQVTLFAEGTDTWE